MLILLLKQTCIDLDEYNDADYVNFDMAEGAQWNKSRRLCWRISQRIEIALSSSSYVIQLSSLSFVCLCLVNPATLETFADRIAIKKLEPFKKLELNCQ